MRDLGFSKIHTLGRLSVNLSSLTYSILALVEFLGASFESLSKLSLKGLIQVDDHSIFSIVDPCSKLTYLDISGCKNLSSNLKRILAQRKRFDVITK